MSRVLSLFVLTLYSSVRVLGKNRVRYEVPYFSMESPERTTLNHDLLQDIGRVLRDQVFLECESTAKVRHANRRICCLDDGP